MEGVMMKNKAEYAIAVRKPNNEIVVEKSTYNDFSDKAKIFKLPIFRGILAFVDSMVVGVKVLNFSASFFEEEEETQTKKNKDKAKNKKAKKANHQDDDFEIDEVSATKADADDQEPILSEEEKQKAEKKEEKSNALLMALAVVISIVMSVALFMVLPVLITNLFSVFITNQFLMAFIEGMMRLAIFIGYIILAAKMPEIKRVFMYHGAEHKTINCLENGFELTVENVRWQSKQHKRCGTSFMLLVMIISLLFFIMIPVNGVMMRVISRVLLVPFIAGISYEFIRLAGRSESKLVNALSQPGLWMQGLTTKEPDDSMIEVAIQSVGAVFDWKAFLETSGKQSATGKQQNNRKQQNVGKQQNTAKKQNTTKQINNSNTEKVTKPAEALKVQEMSKEAMTQQEPFKKQEPKGKTAAVTHTEIGKRNPGSAPIHFKPVVPNRSEEEDDEILRALDKFFDDNHKDSKSGEN